MINDNFLRALRGQRIKRIRIRINQDSLDNLKQFKQTIGGTLDLCEMVECCFDYFENSQIKFDLQKNNLESNPQSIISSLRKEKASVQINIREDIVESLNNIKNRINVPVQQIISQIIDLQINNLKSYLNSKN